MKNSKSKKRSTFFTFCKSLCKLAIAMIFVAASTCLAQKSNWYLFQPNNQGVNVEFGNTSCTQGSNFFKPIKPYTSQTFENYLAVNAQTDKKGKILFYLISTLDSVYLYNSANKCIKVLPGYDVSPLIVPLPGGVRYHLLVGNNLYWFNLSDLTKMNNDIFDFYNATVTGLVKVNVSAQEPKYVVKKVVKIIKHSCDTFIYRLYSLEANVAGTTGRFVRSRDIVSIGDKTTTNTASCSMEIHTNNNIDLRLEYSISEMELSPNKNELVFSGGSCLLRVDVSGSQFGSSTRTCFNSSNLDNDSNRYFCGVEYITDTLILLSQYQVTDSSSANQGLYLFNKITNTFTKITNSDGFKYSYIEKGKDGNAYFTKNDGLYRFNRNSSSISKVLNLSLVPSLPFLRLVTGELLKPIVRVFSLPSVIDNYENETLKDKESVVDSIVIKSPKFSNKQTFGNSDHKLTPRGYGKMRSFQVWDSDTTWHINNLISDTAVFFVNYKGLHDTILSKLDTMSNYNPFHTKPASYFARNLLCFMGKKCNFIDSFYNDLVPITGRVTSNCFGGGVQGISVKLFDEYNVYTGVSTVTEAAGYFRFSGTELTSLDSTNRYYVRVYLPSDSNHISMTAKIRNLQFDSLLNIDCVFPGPAPLGSEKTEIVKITMHPNPVSEDLIISGLKVDRPVQISIVDATGSTKRKFNFESNDGKDVYLDLSCLCSGFYFIIVESDNLNYTEKIIIKRNK